MLAVYLSILDTEEDKNSFEILYNQYVNLMYKVAYDILENKEDAEDAVSEAFCRIAKSFQIVHKKICPKTANQFVIIVRNVAIDTYRKNKIQNDLPLTMDITDDSFNQFSVSDLQYAIEKLSDSDKDILYLNYIYGYEIKEISKLYDISKDAVYKRLQRAKANLKNILEEDIDE